jgi:hypothetical protein
MPWVLVFREMKIKTIDIECIGAGFDVWQLDIGVRRVRGQAADRIDGPQGSQCVMRMVSEVER